MSLYFQILSPIYSQFYKMCMFSHIFKTCIFLREFPQIIQVCLNTHFSRYMHFCSNLSMCKLQLDSLQTAFQISIKFGFGGLTTFWPAFRLWKCEFTRCGFNRFLHLPWQNTGTALAQLSIVFCTFSRFRSWSQMSTLQSSATSVAGMWWLEVPPNGCPLMSQGLCVNGFPVEVGGAGSRRNGRQTHFLSQDCSVFVA